MLKDNLNKLNKGFSLVEMLVAIAIFMSIMTIAISALISIINANKKAQAIKNTVDNVTFAIETISRDMRMGFDYRCSQNNIDFASACRDVNGNNVGGTAVSYSTSSLSSIKYTFNGMSDPSKGILTREVCTHDLKTYCFPPVDLISQDSGVNINNMRFYVIGADTEYNPDTTKTQPRVILTASGIITAKGSAPTEFDLQTSISQRPIR